MTELSKRKIYDLSAPNRSTAIINGESSNVLNWDDVRYSWAYPTYKNMLANFWTPFEINMGKDSKQYAMLEPHEKDAFNKIIGLLAFLDSIQTDYAGKVADYLTDSSLSALMTTLGFQEVVHNQSYSYVLSSVADKGTQDEVFEFWKHDPVLIERNDFIAETYKEFSDNPTPEGLIKSIVKDIILEGLNFFSGFAFFYNLARNQKMVSTSTMINYINRDEEIHVGLFTNIFKAILAENPDLDTEATRVYVRDVFRQAAELEIKWGNHILGNKFDGISMDELDQYIKFIANKRVRNMGLKEHLPFPELPKENPMPWIKHYEDADLGKSDFFEQKSRQYVKITDDNGFDDL
jgi:ribonucleoside-diphosphate reductase beta chain